MRFIAGILLLVTLSGCADINKFMPLERYEAQKEKKWP